MSISRSETELTTRHGAARTSLMLFAPLFTRLLNLALCGRTGVITTLGVHPSHARRNFAPEPSGDLKE